MTSRLGRRILIVGLVALATALLGAQQPAAATPAQEPDPATQILAIVSPLASPVCAAAGSATLLVPIVGGLVGTTLGIGGSVDVADLVLDTVGPLYVVCGSLPASAGSRCELDANIAGVWPAELTGFGLAPPVVVGGVVDALNAVLALAGQPPVAEVAQTLQCVVPDRGGSIAAPTAPPSVADLLVPGASLDGLPNAELNGLPVLGPAAPSAPTPDRLEVPVVGPLVSAIDERVPGGVKVLQAVVALVLLLCLVRSWYTSWRVARR